MEIFSFSDSSWVKIEDTEKIFSQIAPIDGRIYLDSDVSLFERSLPMYENVHLLYLSSDKWEDGLRVCYLKYQDQLFRLNGTSPPIHEINAKAPVQINNENVLYYFSFFCFFVRGEEGPFYVLYDLEDELLPKGFTDVRSDTYPEFPVKHWFRRPRIFGQDKDGRWRTSALIFYSNAVFYADFLVHPTGMIEMQDDEPLMAELSFRINAPLVPSVSSI